MAVGHLAKQPPTLTGRRQNEISGSRVAARAASRPRKCKQITRAIAEAEQLELAFNADPATARVRHLATDHSESQPLFPYAMDSWLVAQAHTHDPSVLSGMLHPYNAPAAERQVTLYLGSCLLYLCFRAADWSLC